MRDETRFDLIYDMLWASPACALHINSTLFQDRFKDVSKGKSSKIRKNQRIKP
jgi:hypothetical protein